jgi:mono/diheme cytochrome c family protein
MSEVRAVVLAFILAVAALGCGGADDASTGGAHDASPPEGSGPADFDAGHGAGVWHLPEFTLPDPDSDVELHLSEVGLYQDITTKKLAPDLISFEPQFKLWSDGADKQRYLRLPPGEQVDSSDMDHWQFPVGTMLFKQFALDGKRLETRLIMRLGPAPEDYWMGAFLWNDDESDAVFVPNGEQNVRGTGHDVPKVKNCFTCHDGDAGRILGFSAIQQPDVAAKLLTDPPTKPTAVPGDEITRAALGDLHANCAHCHNPTGAARPDTDMNLRLSVSDTTPEDTNTYRSTIGVEMQYFESSPLTLRVARGDPDESGLLFRMTERGPKTQMPPLATEITDDDGGAAVGAWIETL